MTKHHRQLFCVWPVGNFCLNFESLNQEVSVMKTRNTLIYGYRDKPLEGNLILCPFNKLVVMHLLLGPIRSSVMSPGQIYSISYAFIVQSGSYIQSENSWLHQ